MGKRGMADAGEVVMPYQNYPALSADAMRITGLSDHRFRNGNTDRRDPEYHPVDNEFGSNKTDMKLMRTISADMNDTIRFTPDYQGSNDRKLAQEGVPLDDIFHHRARSSEAG